MIKNKRDKLIIQWTRHQARSWALQSTISDQGQHHMIAIARTIDLDIALEKQSLIERIAIAARCAGLAMPTFPSEERAMAAIIDAWDREYWGDIA